LSIESVLANARYAWALVQQDIDAAVRAALPAVSVYRVLKRCRETDGTRAEGLLRVSEREVAPVAIGELLADGMGEVLQSRLAEIMLTLALSGTWTEARRRELETAVTVHWGNTELLSPLVEAAAGRLKVDSSTPMPVLVAFSLMTLNDEAVLTPLDRLKRDVYWVFQVGNNMARRALEPLVIESLATGWRHVLTQQSFALSAPFRYTPAIEAAIDNVERNGIRAAPDLIFAAAPAVRFELSDNWRKCLEIVQSA
jgi:hypothetical protein